MIKGSEIRKADFPIEPLLLDRCSPRAMSPEEIADEVSRITRRAWQVAGTNYPRETVAPHNCPLVIDLHRDYRN